MGRRLPHVLYGVYVAVCLACLVWPVYAWAGARIEPRVLGLPFAFAWNVGWVLASFAALFLYDRATQRREGS
jgi:hypothetical protein